MANMYGKGDRGKATKLHAEMVRSLGYCENCGQSHGIQLQCAHIISRKYANTRTLFNNAFCLCAGCHRHFTDHPLEFAEYVSRTQLGDRHDRVRQVAYSMQKVNWSDRLTALKELKGKTLEELREIEWKSLSNS